MKRKSLQFSGVYFDITRLVRIVNVATERVLIRLTNKMPVKVCRCYVYVIGLVVMHMQMQGKQARHGSKARFEKINEEGLGRYFVALVVQCSAALLSVA